MQKEIKNDYNLFRFVAIVVDSGGGGSDDVERERERKREGRERHCRRNQ